MLESKLFHFLEQTEDAAYTVTEAGEICSWNRAAERLFGYPASAVLHHNIDEVLDPRDGSGARPLAEGSASATRRRTGAPAGIPNFDLEVRTRSGRRIWVNVSTIVFESHRPGRILFARLARDIDQHRRNQALVNRMVEAARQLIAEAHDPSGHAVVERLSEQERRILTLFALGRDAATIARKLRISAQTLRNHLHRINRKLRTHNRLEAVTHAQRRGLIEQPREVHAPRTPASANRR
jgi:PAS domain S-box-containing protein